MTVVILLATYNGERYLQQQLDSIGAQTYRQWLLLIRDDASTDATVTISQHYQRCYPVRCRFLGVNEHNSGASQTFAWLIQYVLEHAAGLELDDYIIAFCDQDDIWHDDKLQIGIEHIIRHYQRCAKDKPLLVHSELHVINQVGELLSPGLSRYQGFKPWRNSFADLLFQNVVTGCATMINPALARLGLPVPKAAMMHDWWLALIASLHGQIIFIDQPLLDYRQHDANTIGAAKIQHKPLLARLTGLSGEPINSVLKQVAAQARYFLTDYPVKLTFWQYCACYLTWSLRFDNMFVRAGALVILRYIRRWLAWRQRRVF